MAHAPPRYAPALPLPARPYRPVRSGPRPPRPLLPALLPPGPARRAWREPAALPEPAVTAFRYGVDLFNAACWWEAHEVWEGLWARTVRGTPLFHLLQGLIMLAAAQLKAAPAQPRGAQRLAARAREHLARVQAGAGEPPPLGIAPASAQQACAALQAALERGATPPRPFLHLAHQAAQ
jgi:hypothetical protein